MFWSSNREQSKICSQRPSVIPSKRRHSEQMSVILSVAKNLTLGDETLRYAQGDKAVCHSEQSDAPGPLAPGVSRCPGYRRPVPQRSPVKCGSSSGLMGRPRHILGGPPSLPPLLLLLRPPERERGVR